MSGGQEAWAELPGRVDMGTGQAHPPLIHLIQLGGGMQALHNGRRLHTVHNVRISCQPFLQVPKPRIMQWGCHITRGASSFTPIITSFAENLGMMALPVPHEQQQQIARHV